LESQTALTVVFALLILINAVQFAALGLFYHLFTRRLDDSSATHTREVGALATKLEHVSPLQAYQQLADLRGDVNKVWGQVASLNTNDAARATQVQELAEAVEVLSHTLPAKVDGFMVTLGAQIDGLRDEVVKMRNRRPAAPAQVI